MSTATLAAVRCQGVPAISHSPALLVAVVALLVVPAWSQSTIVVDPQGGEPDFSLDERWLAYTRLSAPRQVYVFDRATATAHLVSKAPSGVPGNGNSQRPSISGDGRWVAFESDATNLVALQTFGVSHVWVHDRISSTNALVSVRSNGTAGNGPSYAPSISADGAFVAFRSQAQLLPQPLNGSQWAYARDLLAGVTHWMGGDTATQAQVGRPAISGDGRVAYFSQGLGTEFGSIFGFAVSPSAVAGGIWPGHAGLANQNPLRDADTTFDGSLVAFIQGYPWDTSNQVSLYDVATDLVERVSVTIAGAQAVGSFGAVRVSSDGTRVAFTGSSQALSPSGSLFLRDRSAGTTTVASFDPAGNHVGARDVALSATGRYVAFGVSGAGTLLLRDTVVCPGFTSYCTSSTTTNGCSPTMSSIGSPSAAAASPFMLQVDDVEGQRMGLIFYGRYPTAQSWALGSTSYLCIFYPVQRLGAVSSGGTAGQCNGALAVDWNTWSAANPVALGQPFLAGDTFCAQGWFRDPGMPKGTNLSNGLRFTFCD